MVPYEDNFVDVSENQSVEKINPVSSPGKIESKLIKTLKTLD